MNASIHWRRNLIVRLLKESRHHLGYLPIALKCIGSKKKAAYYSVAIMLWRADMRARKFIHPVK